MTAHCERSWTRASVFHPVVCNTVKTVPRKFTRHTNLKPALVRVKSIQPAAMTVNIIEHNCYIYLLLYSSEEYSLSSSFSSSGRAPFDRTGSAEAALLVKLEVPFSFASKYLKMS